MMRAYAPPARASTASLSAGTTAPHWVSLTRTARCTDVPAAWPPLRGDDPVVHHQKLVARPRAVRVAVDDTRRAMRGPAGVRQPDMRADREIRLIRQRLPHLGLQDGHRARRLDDQRRAVPTGIGERVIDRNARRGANDVLAGSFHAVGHVREDAAHDSGGERGDGGKSETDGWGWAGKRLDMEHLHSSRYPVRPGAVNVGLTNADRGGCRKENGGPIGAARQRAAVPPSAELHRHGRPRGGRRGAVPRAGASAVRAGARGHPIPAVRGDQAAHAATTISTRSHDGEHVARANDPRQHRAARIRYHGGVGAEQVGGQHRGLPARSTAQQNASAAGEPIGRPERTAARRAGTHVANRQRDCSQRRPHGTVSRPRAHADAHPARIGTHLRLLRSVPLAPPRQRIGVGGGGGRRVDGNVFCCRARKMDTSRTPRLVRVRSPSTPTHNVCSRVRFRLARRVTRVSSVKRTASCERRGSGGVSFRRPVRRWRPGGERFPNFSRTCRLRSSSSHVDAGGNVPLGAGGDAAVCDAVGGDYAGLRAGRHFAAEAVLVVAARALPTVAAAHQLYLFRVVVESGLFVPHLFLDAVQPPAGGDYLSRAHC
eukprot:ctg_172.g95